VLFQVLRKARQAADLIYPEMSNRVPMKAISA
jgi:hypothetical protein